MHCVTGAFSLDTTMKKPDLHTTGVLILAVASIVTAVLMVYSASPWGDNYAYQSFSDYLSLAAFALWALSPYVLLGYLLYLFCGTRPSCVVAVTGAGILSICGIAVYIDTVFVHIDAQGALVFVFFPAYQWIAAVILGITCRVLHRRGTM